jgi:hypothetical protein
MARKKLREDGTPSCVYVSAHQRVGCQTSINHAWRGRDTLQACRTKVNKKLKCPAKKLRKQTNKNGDSRDL